MENVHIQSLRALVDKLAGQNPEAPIIPVKLRKKRNCLSFFHFTGNQNEETFISIYTIDETNLNLSAERIDLRHGIERASAARQWVKHNVSFEEAKKAIDAAFAAPQDCPINTHDFVMGAEAPATPVTKTEEYLSEIMRRAGATATSPDSPLLV